MNKGIVFVDDCTDGCQNPVFAEQDKSEMIVVSEANELVVFKNKKEVLSLKLTEKARLGAKERVVLAIRTAENQLLVGTASHQFHLLNVTKDAQNVVNVIAEQLNFKYGKTLKSLCNKKAQKWQKNVIFASGRFLFSLSLKSKEFKILKLLNSDVLRFVVSENKLLVLTKRELSEFAFNQLSDVCEVTKKEELTAELESFVTFELWNDKLVLLNSKSEVTVRTNQPTFPLLSKFKITSAFHGDAELSFISPFENGAIAVGNRNIVYQLQNNMTQVKTAFSIEKYSNLLLPSGLLTFGSNVSTSSSKSKQTARFGVLSSEGYTKASKRRQFESKPIPLQLQILKVYLLKKAFERNCFPNQIELFRQLMQRIVLKKEILKDTGMKQMVVEFFESLRLFTVEKFGKVYLCKPKVANTVLSRSSRTSSELKDGASEADTADSLSASPKTTDTPKSLPVLAAESPQKQQVCRKLNFNSIALKKTIRKNKKALFRQASKRLRQILKTRQLHDDDRLDWMFYIARKFKLNALYKMMFFAAHRAHVELAFRGQRKLKSCTDKGANI